jgi:hypothetical protein
MKLKMNFHSNGCQAKRLFIQKLQILLPPRAVVTNPRPARLMSVARKCFYARSQNCEKQLLPSSCLSVCLSVCLSAWNNSAPTGRILIKFDVWMFFDKVSRKLKISLKSDNNNGYFTWRPMYIYDNISLNSS